jgi:hypothetical protein
MSRGFLTLCCGLAVATTTLPLSPAVAATYFAQSPDQQIVLNTGKTLIVSVTVPKGNWIISTSTYAADQSLAQEGAAIACLLAVNGNYINERDVGNLPTGGNPIAYDIVNQMVVTLTAKSTIGLYCEDEQGLPNVLIAAQRATLIVSPAGAVK